MTVSSWGNYPKVTEREYPFAWRTDSLPNALSLLPHGLGRSYGDVALNEGGSIITTQRLNNFISFDANAGSLRCESGVSLAEILQLIVPAGWFLPVTPGTKFVSIGGAIANDIHGKNHHRAGSFGAYVTQFELLRSDSRYLCTPQENAKLFRATIGGLGLTGLITWAELRLAPMPSRLLSVDSLKTHNLAETINTLRSSLTTHEYVIASLDTSAPRRGQGRGIVLRGNHLAAPQVDTREKTQYCPPRFTVPFILPFCLLTPATIKVFCRLYYHRQLKKKKHGLMHYDPFFYPQDAIGYWNRLYGPRGFLQYQCQVPEENAQEVLRTILEQVATHGFASPITTLKPLGQKNNPGLLSFPRPGYTLALDFPNTGRKLFDVLDQLDVIVQHAGGSLYPAKDARMSPEMFRHSYPEIDEFSQYIDPAFSSSFWRRVTKKL